MLSTVFLYSYRFPSKLTNRKPSSFEAFRAQKAMCGRECAQTRMNVCATKPESRSRMWHNSWREITGAKVDMDKRVANADAAIGKLKDGATILLVIWIVRYTGKFDCGGAEARNEESYTGKQQCRTGRFRNWIAAANASGEKMIATYVGENKLFEQLVLKGELEVELNPQGRWRNGCARVAQEFRRFSLRREWAR